MNKAMQIYWFVCLLSTVVSTACWSMDFVNMSDQELFELRGAIHNAPEADKAAYQAEWEQRLSCMTDEEKKLFDEQAKKDEPKEGELDQPRVPAQGYEKEGVRGRIIFGAVPEENGSGR